MNRSKLILVPIAILLFAGAWAQETDPVHDISRDWAELKAQRAENQARLDVLISIMSEEMAAIRATGNRDDRETLMVKHREHMHEAIGLMDGMSGKHMREVMAEHTGSGVKQETDGQQQMHMSTDESGPHAGMSVEERIGDLEIRMDMMSIMMESMMEADSH